MIVIGAMLNLNAIINICNATRVVRDDHSDHEQQLVNSDPEDCPPWFYYDWETQSCQCLTFYGARCFNNKAYLLVSFCATLDKHPSTVKSDTMMLTLSDF